MDKVEELHEAARTMSSIPELAWLQEMRPITELCSGEQAHLFIRGLTLSHLDATLKHSQEAQRFLGGDLEAEFANRGIDAVSHRPL
jgi:hypothetical protein